MRKRRRCAALRKTPRALHGVRVLVTRAPDQSSNFIELLERHGAQVSTVPLIRIGPPPNERTLQQAIDNADAYDWLIFTSAEGVKALAQRRNRPLRGDLRIAVVGPATDQAVAEELGLRASVMPSQHSAAHLADAIISHAQAPQSMLLVAAKDASPVLAAKLRERGHRVDKLDAYTTVESPPLDLQASIARNDVIALASPSAVRALVRGLGHDAAAALRGKLLACIGPATLLEARERGLHVEIVPALATLPALVDALCRYYTTQRS